ncbi:hypothetical protein JTB14_032517 [Gonioctena quinquepunctata]|nr:hypothetical protein JTB14_032517 [Gonioctena quinquepunctata]
MFMEICIVAICVGMCFIVNHLNLRQFICVAKLPGAERFPVLGHFPHLMCDDVFVFKKVRKWSRKYAPIYSIFMSSFFPTVQISGAEEFEVIAATTKNMKKAPIYYFLRRWLGKGLILSTGTRWHMRRKMLTPAFHFSSLQQFVSVFNSETDRLVETLEKEEGKSSTDVVPFIAEFSLFTVAESFLATKLNMETKEDKKYVTGLRKMNHLYFDRAVKPWWYFPQIYYTFSTNGREEKEIVDTLHKFTNDIISDKSKNFDKVQVEHEDYNYAKNKKLAFLDILLNAKINKGIIDNEGIRDEVNTFMFAGYDTTSTSICFSLMLLANHKEWQDSIYEEVTQILSHSTEHPNMNDLNEMKILERFIKESLRLYPSVPLIARTLGEDTEINGFVLPKGVPVHIHIYDIHRNPKYWPKPDEFDPDRFLPSNCVNRHPFAYVPFSAGPRNCIGQKFAMLEMKAVLCGILRNFILEAVDTPDNIQLIPHMVLRTKNGSLK